VNAENVERGGGGKGINLWGERKLPGDFDNPGDMFQQAGTSFPGEEEKVTYLQEGGSRSRRSKGKKKDNLTLKFYVNSV